MKIIYKKLSKIKEARECFLETLKIDPKNKCAIEELK